MKSLLENDYGAVLKQSKAAVVEFKSKTCAHCKAMEKIVEEIESKTENVDFYQVDIEENQQAVEQYRIMSVPTFVFLKNGNLTKKLVGETHEALIQQAIDNLKK